jgi:hypothetical protein
VNEWQLQEANHQYGELLTERGHTDSNGYASVVFPLGVAFKATANDNVGIACQDFEAVFSTANAGQRQTPGGTGQQHQRRQLSQKPAAGYADTQVRFPALWDAAGDEARSSR